MALVFRVTNISYIDQNYNEAGRADNLDLSLQGQVQIVTDYLDDSDLNTVLFSYQHRIPFSEDVNAIIERISAYGRMVQGAREVVTALTPSIGAVIPVNPAPSGE